MRRVIAIALAAMGLAGCSTFSWDAFKSTPPSIQVQLESNPPGADARTSIGPGCKTPCAVTLPAPETGFSVTYTLNKFQPVTIPVQIIRTPGDINTPAGVTTDPNPVYGELQPIAPPAPVKPPHRPKKKAPKAAPPPATASSPFPDPNPTSATPSR